MSKKKKFWIIFFLILGLIFILLLFVSAVLNIGEKLRNIHKYVEYGFYALAGILLLFLIIIPLFEIFFKPTFNVDLESDEEHAKDNYHLYKTLAKNIQNLDYVSDDDKKKVMDVYKDPIQLKTELTRIYDENIKKKLNQEIIKNATTVMISTAISQNGKLDAITILVCNIKLISRLVKECGFRPRNGAMLKLVYRVLTAALIADGIESLSFSELFPTQAQNFLAEIPLIKPITKSLADGMANAVLSLRIGIITRNYLFMDVKGVKKSKIKKLAFGEALLLLPLVIKDVVAFLPKTIKGLVSKQS